MFDALCDVTPKEEVTFLLRLQTFFYFCRFFTFFNVFLFLFERFFYIYGKYGG